jgi:hypothetical protein
MNSIWKEELPDQWKESIIVPVHKKGDKTDCSNYQGVSTSYKILSNILLSRLIPYKDEIIGVYQCGFRNSQLLIRSFAFVRYWRKNESTMRQHNSYS